jgi:hypothetical protein
MVLAAKSGLDIRLKKRTCLQLGVCNINNKPIGLLANAEIISFPVIPRWNIGTQQIFASGLYSLPFV